MEYKPNVREKSSSHTEIDILKDTAFHQAYASSERGPSV